MGAHRPKLKAVLLSGKAPHPEALSPVGLPYHSNLLPPKTSFPGNKSDGSAALLKSFAD